MTILRRFLLMTLLLFTHPVGAQDVAYPIGGRIGLVPPAGLTPSQAFQGFEDRENEVGIIVVALPPQAYAELEKSLTAEALKKEGIALEKREQVTTPIGKALIVLGRQAAQGKAVRKWVMIAAGAEFTALVTAQIPEAAVKSYPDAAIRAALVTLNTRDKVPDAEQLSLLPFTMGSLAEFRIAAVVPGRAILLNDATRDVAGAAYFLVSIGPETPSQTEDRDTFARRMFGSVGNVKDVTILSSEPLRLAGQLGHQILADAKDAETNTDLKIVQWLRFGGGAHMQMIGAARRDDWNTAFSRFRAVRDGISLR